MPKHSTTAVSGNADTPKNAYANTLQGQSAQVADARSGVNRAAHLARRRLAPISS